MDTPNEDILLIDESPYDLRYKGGQLKVMGQFIFKWLPSPRVILKGECLDDFYDVFWSVFEDETPNEFELVFESKSHGQLFLSNWNSKGEFELLVNKELKVPKYEKCDSITFHIPNLHRLDFPERGKLDENDPLRKNIITLDWNDFRLQIRQVDNSIGKFRELKKVGGYIITYEGQLIRTAKNKKITSTQWRLLSAGLRSFLSFIGGRQTGPILESGYDKKKRVWSNVSSVKLKRYEGSIGQTIRDADFLIKYWPKFMEISSDKEQGQILRDVLHWYLAAKSNADYTNNSIVLSQISLEILFHWVVRLRKKALDKNANLSAANQFRLMLSLLNVDTNVPDKYVKINQKIKSDQKLMDGIDFIVQVRNSQVHSNDNNKPYSTMELYECKELFLHYIKHSLIAIMDEEV